MALYSVLLELDNPGVLKVMDYICSEFIINNKIRPNINIGAFLCDRETQMLDFYSGLSQFLEPVHLEFEDVGMFENGTVFLRPKMDEKLKANYYKTYATLSKHFDAGFNGRYLPSVWQPYVTVGFMPCPEDAKEMCEYLKGIFSPFKCKLSTSALVRCEPYNVIARAPLVFDAI